VGTTANFGIVPPRSSEATGRRSQSHQASYPAEVAARCLGRTVNTTSSPGRFQARRGFADVVQEQHRCNVRSGNRPHLGQCRVGNGRSSAWPGSVARGPLRPGCRCQTDEAPHESGGPVRSTPRSWVSTITPVFKKPGAIHHLSVSMSWLVLRGRPDPQRRVWFHPVLIPVAACSTAAAECGPEC